MDFLFVLLQFVAAFLQSNLFVMLSFVDLICNCDESIIFEFSPIHLFFLIDELLQGLITLTSILCRHQVPLSGYLHGSSYQTTISRTVTVVWPFFVWFCRIVIVVFYPRQWRSRCGSGLIPYFCTLQSSFPCNFFIFLYKPCQEYIIFRDFFKRKFCPCSRSL